MRSLVLLVAVSGCNQIFDLDEPEQVQDIRDADGDAFVDSRDNCPNVANPDQEDSDDDRRGDACDDCPTSPPTRDLDADGVDDACDSCILGPQIDDDGDAVMDACDLCPVTFAAIQLDEDGDLIGDVCDTPVGQNIDSERGLFEPFTSLAPEWVGSEDWESGSDGSSVVSTVSASLVYTPTNADRLVATSMSFEAPPDSHVSLDLSTDTGCEVSCTQGKCILVSRSERGRSEVEIESARGTLQVSLGEVGFDQVALVHCALRVDDLPAITTSHYRSGSDVRRGLTIAATAGVKVYGVDLLR
ncbi:MAG: thrombospondin type 3 repeat-containing protein [Kofleriaceae bacterium]